MLLRRILHYLFLSSYAQVCCLKGILMWKNEKFKLDGQLYGRDKSNELLPQTYQVKNCRKTVEKLTEQKDCDRKPSRTKYRKLLFNIFVSFRPILWPR